MCKLEDYAAKQKERRLRAKEIEKENKVRVMKEMFCTGGIEPRDFLTKMDKVDSFLKKGHPVKVTIMPKLFTKNNRFKDGVRRDRMSGEH